VEPPEGLGLSNVGLLRECDSPLGDSAEGALTAVCDWDGRRATSKLGLASKVGVAPAYDENFVTQGDTVQEVKGATYSITFSTVKSSLYSTL
jgi:hypothetical protein